MHKNGVVQADPARSSPRAYRTKRLCQKQLYVYRSRHSVVGGPYAPINPLLLLASFQKQTCTHGFECVLEPRTCKLFSLYLNPTCHWARHRLCTCRKFLRHIRMPYQPTHVMGISNKYVYCVFAYFQAVFCSRKPTRHIRCAGSQVRFFLWCSIRVKPIGTSDVSRAF